MQVVLRADVKGLGRKGDLAEVSDGYARNYLFPRRLAEEATMGALKKMEEVHRAEALRQQREEQAARAQADRLRDQVVTIRMKTGDQGRLFGAVTAADIAAAIKKTLGVQVDRRRLEIGDPIKHLGEVAVEVRLAADVRTSVRVLVEAEKGG